MIKYITHCLTIFCLILVMQTYGQTDELVKLKNTKFELFKDLYQNPIINGVEATLIQCVPNIDSVSYAYFYICDVSKYENNHLIQLKVDKIMNDLEIQPFNYWKYADDMASITKTYIITGDEYNPEILFLFNYNDTNKDFRFAIINRK